MWGQEKSKLYMGVTSFSSLRIFFGSNGRVHVGRYVLCVIASVLLAAALAVGGYVFILSSLLGFLAPIWGYGSRLPYLRLQKECHYVKASDKNRNNCLLGQEARLTLEHSGEDCMPVWLMEGGWLPKSPTCAGLKKFDMMAATLLHNSMSSVNVYNNLKGQVSRRVYVCLPNVSCSGLMKATRQCLCSAKLAKHRPK